MWCITIDAAVIQSLNEIIRSVPTSTIGLNYFMQRVDSIMLFEPQSTSDWARPAKTKSWPYQPVPLKRFKQVVANKGATKRSELIQIGGELVRIQVAPNFEIYSFFHNQVEGAKLPKIKELFVALLLRSSLQPFLTSDSAAHHSAIPSKSVAMLSRTPLT